MDERFDWGPYICHLQFVICHHAPKARVAPGQFLANTERMRRGTDTFQTWIRTAKTRLLIGILTFVLASCTNVSTTITGDALTEFQHSSRTSQEPRNR
jgi:hypothetical protein